MMKVMILGVLAGCWTGSPPPPIANATAPVSPRAHMRHASEEWAGTGTQYDNGETWQIELVIDPRAPVGGQLGTVIYPSLGCRGTLQRIESAGPDLVAVERLTDNPGGACVDGGTMRIPLQRGERFYWRWYAPGAPDTVLADGELTRR